MDSFFASRLRLENWPNVNVDRLFVPSEPIDQLGNLT
jgi:hypothetical protein